MFFGAADESPVQAVQSSPVQFGLVLGGTCNFIAGQIEVFQDFIYYEPLS